MTPQTCVESMVSCHDASFWTPKSNDMGKGLPCCSVDGISSSLELLERRRAAHQRKVTHRTLRSERKLGHQAGGGLGGGGKTGGVVRRGFSINRTVQARSGSLHRLYCTCGAQRAVCVPCGRLHAARRAGYAPRTAVNAQGVTWITVALTASGSR